MPKNDIVQLTIVHPRNDTRILFREVRSIAHSECWMPILIVADGNGSGMQRLCGTSVAIHDVGKPPGGRLGRVIIGSARAISQVRRVDPILIHFHDPELIPAGILLKLLGYRVIYDVHEDVPRDIKDKYWLPRAFRHVLSWSVGLLEWLGAKLFDGIVSATPKIAGRFPSRKTIVVQNFPILSELTISSPVPYEKRKNSFVYVGAISELRGAYEMTESIGKLDERYQVRLELAGPFRPVTLQDELRSIPGHDRVNFHGWLNRERVATVLGETKAGLVVLHPTPAYKDAYPVKMFEYMAAGLPVIASDFPLWRQIVEDARCGILVNPLEPRAIADAMRWILEHPLEAAAMGQRGRNAVEEKYNWIPEEGKLLTLYHTLLDRKP